MKNKLLLAVVFMLVYNAAFSQTRPTLDQSQEIESHRIQNIKSGKKGDDGLVSRLRFTFEDFNLFQKHATDIEQALKERAGIEQFLVQAEGQTCTVSYLLVNHPVNDFLKIFKETIGGFKVLVYSYEEELIIKNN